MAVSNKFGPLVLTTGNKSEVAVGYATLYGDMAGGYNVLKDVFKTMVYRLAEWRNRDKELIPRTTIERAPSAELRPDQKDQDSLPPYDVLDAILTAYIEEDVGIDEIVGRGFDRKLVQRIIGLVDRAEYKRRQAAPGVKISGRAFGRDRRMPITNRYRQERAFVLCGEKPHPGSPRLRYYTARQWRLAILKMHGGAALRSRRPRSARPP
jgi:NAD+ synthase (glutamine-hydrolysing)